jgi:Na+-transporting NADH:ubiquinone oxidoreductase subunit NqrF
MAINQPWRELPKTTLRDASNKKHWGVILAGGDGTRLRAAFLTKLEALEQQNRNYRLIATMTQPEKSICAWMGEVGLVDYQMLDRHLKAAAFPDWYSARPIYYIAGPRQMVRNLQTMLTNAGVDSVISE